MKITLVLSHPDDEIIFGWPIFQNFKEYEKELIVCSNDKNNLKRTWCKNRYIPLSLVCKDLDINHTCLDYDSEFYRMTTRDESLKRMIDDVIVNIEKTKPDYIFTHNSIGEYGHLDHILVNNICSRLNYPLLTSDIVINNNWMSLNDVNFRYNRNMMFLENCENDLIWYDRFERIYRDYKVWTWNQAPIMKCNIYLQ